MISALNSQQVANQIISFDKEKQKLQLRLFARLPLDGKLAIMEMKREQFFKLLYKYKDTDKALISYSALIIAINKFANNLDNNDYKSIKFEEKFYSKTSKKDKLCSYWSVVDKLKNEKGYSFRKISEYLKNFYHFEVAHSTIYSTWKEVEINKNKGENYE